MLQFLIIFFAVASFDWIDMIKEKRKNEIVFYLLISIIVIFTAYNNQINTSISEFILK